MDREPANGPCQATRRWVARGKRRNRPAEEFRVGQAGSSVGCHQTPPDPHPPMSTQAPRPMEPRNRSALARQDSTVPAEALSGPDVHQEWIVLLEAAAGDHATFLDIGTVRAILELMDDQNGVGLHSPARVAVQVRVRGSDQAMALSTALSRWNAAAGTLVPAGWDLVRAEVLTLDEFERDCQAG